MRGWLLVFGFSSGVLVSACGGAPEIVSMQLPSDGGGAFPDGGEVGIDQEVDAAGRCATLHFGSEPPGLLVELLVDVSAPMGQPALGSSQTRWEALRDALATTIGSLGRGIALELATFPSDGQCAASAPLVSLDLLTPDHTAAVVSAIQAAGPPSGAAPAHDALGLAVDRLSPLSLVAMYPRAARTSVIILGDVPKADPSCTFGADPLQEFVRQKQRAFDGVPFQNVAIVGLSNDAASRSALQGLGATPPTIFMDCGASFPEPCVLPISRDVGSLAMGMGELFRYLSTSFGVDATCSFPLPEFPDGSTIDTSRLTMVMSVEDSPPKTWTLARDEACVDGWRITPDHEHFEICGPACGARSVAARALFWSVDFRFDCVAN